MKLCCEGKLIFLFVSIRLISVVQKAVAAYHKSGQFDNSAVKVAFVNFFAHVMGNYREFLSKDEAPLPSNADEVDPLKSGSSIDIDAFLASKKGKVRVFMEVFALSQHFEQFVKEVSFFSWKKIWKKEKYFNFSLQIFNNF